MRGKRAVFPSGNLWYCKDGPKMHFPSRLQYQVKFQWHLEIQLNCNINQFEKFSKPGKSLFAVFCSKKHTQKTKTKGQP